MSLHSWFGTHVANLTNSHWRGGQFVSACTICGRDMVKLPGQPWRVLEGAQ